MNQVYKSLWNESTGSYVAAPETAIAAGQQVSSARTARRALGRVQTQRLVLEPRIVFDGALPVAVVDMMDTTTPFVDADNGNSAVEAEIAENPTDDAKNVESLTVDAVKTTADSEQDAEMTAERTLIDGTLAQNNLTSTEIIFIDALVSDLEAYITDHPNADVVLIDSSKDGLEQIAAVLAGRTGVESIHILSHGAAGQLTLGNAIVDLQSINSGHADELAVIKAALSNDADILIYGCDVAAGSAGQAFVDALASATGADIAASTDLTGSAALGGNWVLEQQVGVVDTQNIEATEWAHLMVNTVINPTGGDDPTGADGLRIYVTNLGQIQILYQGEENRAQLQLQQEQFLAEQAMYSDDISRLNISAPFAGKLMDVDPLLTAGVWVKPDQPLGVVVDPNNWLADVLINEEDVKRIAVGNQVTLHQATSLEVQHGKVIEIDTTKASVLPHPIMDAKSGGSVVTLETQQYVPRDTLYRVRVALDTPPPQLQMETRDAIIEGERSAWLPSVFKRIAAVLVRESGF